MTRDVHWKCVIIGDMAVGKSSLCRRFVEDKYDECQESTGAVADIVQRRNISYNDMKVHFEIWDTKNMNQEHLLDFTSAFYSGAHVAVIVYDIIDRDSFKQAKAWVDQLQKNMSSNLIIALAGNKLDLFGKRNVQRDEALRYAEENKLLFLETSAKTSENVTAIFLATAIYGQQIQYIPNDPLISQAITSMHHNICSQLFQRVRAAVAMNLISSFYDDVNFIRASRTFMDILRDNNIQLADLPGELRSQVEFFVHHGNVALSRFTLQMVLESIPEFCDL